MIDVVVRSDTVVTPQGVGAYDIAIDGERIVAMAASGSLPIPEGAKLIDATGKIVMPGGIDPHVHCKWFLPNPDGSAALTDPPDVVGRAAVHGGTTTIIDFTRASQGTDMRDAIEKREEDWKGHCACDYAQHIMVEATCRWSCPGNWPRRSRRDFLRLRSSPLTSHPRARDAWWISATSGKCSRC
jgi:dihydropyrimidinase